MVIDNVVYIENENVEFIIKFNAFDAHDDFMGVEGGGSG